MDFGRSRNEFWHTWWPRGPEELNSPAFKAELQEVVDTLRESVLKNRFAMERFCYEHGGKISGGWTQNYGYIVETEHYRYCLRCNPSPGDYNGYLTSFDLDVQRQNMARDNPLVGRVTYANGDAQEFTDAEAFLKCVREELPYRPTTGFRYEVLTEDPAVREAVDDIAFDLYGEENPRQLEEYQKTPKHGRKVSMDRKMVNFIKEQYPPGTRIRLNSTVDPYAPVAPGTEGEVDFVDDIGTIHMRWDNGRALGIVPGEDSFTVLSPKLTTLKLYMPLTDDLYERNEYGDFDDSSTLLEGSELRGYQDHITAALVKNRMPEETERGLMHWYDEADSI